jgi:hypothetical protein
VIKQVLDSLLAPALFVGIKMRKGVTWKPRLLASVALGWALSGQQTLRARQGWSLFHDAESR